MLQGFCLTIIQLKMQYRYKFGSVNYFIPSSSNSIIDLVVGFEAVGGISLYFFLLITFESDNGDGGSAGVSIFWVEDDDDSNSHNLAALNFFFASSSSVSDKDKLSWIMWDPCHSQCVDSNN